MCAHIAMSKCSMTKVNVTKVEKHRLDLALDLGLTAQWLQQFARSTEVSTHFVKLMCCRLAKSYCIRWRITVYLFFSSSME